jgi:hypothetical protein
MTHAAWHLQPRGSQAMGRLQLRSINSDDAAASSSGSADSAGSSIAAAAAATTVGGGSYGTGLGAAATPDRITYHDTEHPMSTGARGDHGIDHDKH